MKVRLTQDGYRLRAGELISLEQAAGYELVCHRGIAWLTMEGRAQDIWLHPTERFVLYSNSKVVVEGMSSADDAQFSLVAPKTAGTTRLSRLLRDARTVARELFRAPSPLSHT